VIGVTAALCWKSRFVVLQRGATKTSQCVRFWLRLVRQIALLLLFLITTVPTKPVGAYAHGKAGDGTAGGAGGGGLVSGLSTLPARLPAAGS